MDYLTVVYDANVLYPAPLRDLLMHLAMADLFAARWSEAIHEEWITGVLKNRPDLSRERLERTRKFMDESVRDAVVTGYEPLISTLTLPDPDDLHGLAAAIHSKANVIVTMNLKDFPERVLSPHDIVAQHPDDFVLRLLELDAEAVLEAVRTQQEGLANPPQTMVQLLHTLERQGLSQTVSKLRGWLE
jgi:predicted nucleic acid-binding protein